MSIEQIMGLFLLGLAAVMQIVGTIAERKGW